MPRSIGRGQKGSVARYVGFCLLCCSGLLALIHRERGGERRSNVPDDGIWDGAESARALGRSPCGQPARKTTIETAT